MSDVSRVTFLIDGFNLYHSIKDGDRYDTRSLRWLDLASLCRSCVPILGTDARLEDVWYFSAYAYYLTPQKPGVVTRHKTYVSALLDSGVKVELSRFKEKDIRCRICHQVFVQPEEKETDVAIAAKLLELLHRDACDIAVLISGDTDLIPAIRTGQHLFPDKRVVVGFPDRRANAQLKQAVPFSFKIKRKRYADHQFPEKIGLASGRVISKPAAWS
jgi:uncharacterized LabA/DUF88 family protein